MEDNLSLPNFLDLLIILDEETTYTKIYKSLPRCRDYSVRGLHYLESKGLVTIKENPKDGRAVLITLTPKGKDAQRMVLTLYALMDVRRG